LQLFGAACRSQEQVAQTSWQKIWIKSNMGCQCTPKKKDVVTWFLWILKTTSILRGLNKAILVVASIRMTPSSSWDKASDWAKGTRNLSRHPVGSCRLEIQLMIHSSKMIGQPNIFFLQDGRHLELKINEDG
jgi:hypothetical protein